MTKILAMLGVLALATVSGRAAVIPFISDEAASVNPVAASFSGWMEYYPAPGTLTVSLTNTSPAANGGFLTGFLFNIDGDATATLSPNPTGWFENTGSQAASPLGTFEVGAALGGNWMGGGVPGRGIGVGQTLSFDFAVSGPGAAGLTTDSFFPQNSGQPGFVVRFTGFNDGTSDKVPAIIDLSRTDVPEPLSAWSGLVIAGLIGLGRRRAKR